MGFPPLLNLSTRLSTAALPGQTTKMAQTLESMFQNVAYRPTVYRTGHEPNRGCTKKGTNQKEHESKRARTKNSTNQKQHESKRARNQKSTNQKGRESKTARTK